MGGTAVAEWADIEGAVRGLIAGLEGDGGRPLFAAVTGIGTGERRAIAEAAGRLAKPAALVAVSERAAGSAGLLGDPRLRVYVAAGELRSAEGLRLGEVDAAGVFELSGRVTAALDGAVIGGQRRLTAIDEEWLTGDERLAIIAQVYLVERPASLSLPTFGDEVITGAGAVVAVDVGAVRSAAVEFAFPGIDGVYRHGLGTRGRTIRWGGQLRAGGHAELNAIEEGIEALIGDGRDRPIADGFGRVFPRCVAESFERIGPRRVHPSTGMVVQSFELTFQQVGA